MPFLVGRTSRPLAYAHALIHRKNEVAIKEATRNTIVRNPSLRAAMLDGSLTIRTVRAAVVAECSVSADDAAALKTTYRDCIRAEMLSVREAFQECRIWSDVAEVETFDDVSSTCGFEPGRVCRATVETAAGERFYLFITKKCHRLSAFPWARNLHQPIKLRRRSYIPEWVRHE